METTMETPSKRFPLSYSRINTFQTCPRKFEYLYVEKTVQDEGSAATDYGTRVHASLEQYGLTGDESYLTDETRKHKALVDRIRNRPGERFFEQKMAVNADRQPCDWYADDVWLRAILDVLVIDGGKAMIFDWKTGKPKNSTLQLLLFSAMTMAHHEQVEKAKAAFIWLGHDKHTPMSFHREELPRMFDILDRQANAIDKSVDSGLFPASPGPLCNWCPAKNICSDRRR